MIHVLLVNEMLLMGNIIAAAFDDEADIQVVGCVTTVQEALEKSRQKEVDVLLVSTRLPDQGALVLTQAVSAELPSIDVLLLGLTEEKEKVLKYVEAGAAGYVVRDESVDDLIEKIRQTQAGKAFVSPEVAAAMMKRLSKLAHMFASLESSVVDDAGLTHREQQVLELLAQNKTNQEIADQLVIEVGTVKNHVHSILEKLHVSSRGEAASYLALFKPADMG